MKINKVALDTNILMDICQPSRLGHDDAKTFLKFTQGIKIELSCTSLSLCTLPYLLRKESRQSTVTKLNFLIDKFQLLQVNKENIKEAIKLNLDDLEDAFQLMAAKKAGVQLFVTSDADLLKFGEMPEILIYSTSQALDFLKNQISAE